MSAVRFWAYGLSVGFGGSGIVITNGDRMNENPDNIVAFVVRCAQLRLRCPQRPRRCAQTHRTLECSSQWTSVWIMAILCCPGIIASGCSASYLYQLLSVGPRVFQIFVKNAEGVPVDLETAVTQAEAEAQSYEAAHKQGAALAPAPDVAVSPSAALAATSLSVALDTTCASTLAPSAASAATLPPVALDATIASTLAPAKELRSGSLPAPEPHSCRSGPGTASRIRIKWLRAKQSVDSRASKQSPSEASISQPVPFLRKLLTRHPSQAKTGSKSGGSKRAWWHVLGGEQIASSPSAGPSRSLYGSRFDGSEMVTGQPITSALGVHRFLGVEDATLYRGLSEGVPAIEREFEAHGTADDLECLEYVLRQASGSNQRVWANGVLDEGREAGLLLHDFVQHPAAKQANLTVAHVLALRLYSTAAYRSLNAPLRDGTRTGPHPFAVTIAFINEA